MRIISALILLFLTCTSNAQVVYDKFNPFVGDQNARPSGLYFGIGGTYTIPAAGNDGTFSDGSLTYNVNFENKGKFGPFAEFGRWHILNYGPFQSVEYGITYRQYGGSEDYTAMEIPDLMNGEPASTGNGKFNSHYAHFNFLFNSAFKINKLSFAQISLGGDIGYRFINSNEYQIELGNVSSINTIEVREELTSHLNVRLSFAHRVNRTYWIPFIQTSFVNLRELSLREANLPYFNSRYKPVIFGLRLQWLNKKRGRECAKKGPKNKKIYKKSTSLFGKDVKSKQLKK